MFNAGSGSGFGLNDGLGGVYEEDAARRGSAQRRADSLLSCGDVYRCALFFGPCLILWGLALLVFATADPERHTVREYNAAVSAWSGPTGGCAEFAATLPPLAGPATVWLTFPPANASLLAKPTHLSVPLYGSNLAPPRLGNATRRVATTPAASQLSFSGVGNLMPPGVPPGGTSAWASMAPGVGGGAFAGAGTSLVVASCSNTMSLQMGVNCSADSPPAPAPSAATELFVLERRRRRGRALLQSDEAEPLSGVFGSATTPASRPPVATTCRAYYRTITLLSAATLVASPPAPPDGVTIVSPNWTLSVAPCFSQHTVLNAPVTEALWHADSRQSPPAWCDQWQAVLAGVGALAGAPAPTPTITLTLRASGDPLLAAASLTRCRMELGPPPADYARRGASCMLVGAALTAGGLWGLARAAAAEGHALGVATPGASLRMALRAVTTYGAVEGGEGSSTAAAALGTPAAFFATVGDKPAAAYPPQPPRNAAPFDGVTPPPRD